MTDEKKIVVEHIKQEEKTEGIKLIKNTKGYNYEIKVNGDLSNSESIANLIKRLDETVVILEEKYGTGL